MKKLFVLLGITALVWLIVQFPSLMISPGELLADHQTTEDDCFKCHDAFGGISNDKCISCHKLTEIGMKSRDSSTMFHSKLSNVNCTSCHTDHQGAHPTGLITTFEHEILNADLRSNCTACHSAPTDLLHPLLSTECGNCHMTDGWMAVSNFDHNFISDSDRNNCTRCHTPPSDEFHSATTGSCAECHATGHWSPSTFDHSKFFVFDKNHTTQCSTCHTNNNYTAYTCYGCHEHSESNIRAEHQEEGILNYQNCVSCHRSGNEDAVNEHGNSENNGKEEANKIERYLKNSGEHDKEEDD